MNSKRSMQDASAEAVHTQNYIEIRKSEARLQSRYGNGITCETTTERTIRKRQQRLMSIPVALLVLVQPSICRGRQNAQQRHSETQ